MPSEVSDGTAVAAGEGCADGVTVTDAAGVETGAWVGVIVAGTGPALSPPFGGPAGSETVDFWEGP